MTGNKMLEGGVSKKEGREWRKVDYTNRYGEGARRRQGKGKSGGGC